MIVKKPVNETCWKGIPKRRKAWWNAMHKGLKCIFYIIQSTSDHSAHMIWDIIWDS